MKLNIKAMCLRPALTSAIVSVTGTSFARLKRNPTAGYGDAKVFASTDFQNFDCID
jgi:hypothetical protein